MDGSAGEIMFERLLSSHRNTFTRVRPRQSSKQLVNLMLKEKPYKVRSLMNAGGWELSDLYSQDEEEILDRLYKCDFLVEVELESGDNIRVVIDVTTNPDEIEDKEHEMRGLMFLYSEIDVSMAIVAYWQEQKFDPSDRQTSYTLAGLLLEDIERIFKKNIRVGTSILAVEK